MATYDPDAYQGLSQEQHVLKRPNVYIGSIKSQLQSAYVYQDSKISLQEVNYSAGFERIFLEVLTNAGDNVERSRQSHVHPGKIKINLTTQEIRVWNSGKVIPVKQKTINDQSIWIPEWIFGTFNTSSNYQDDTEKTWAGVNGLGIKLTNIFSQRFQIRIGDPIHQKLYEQTWSNNMSERSEPQLSKYSQKEGFVEVTYQPDCQRLLKTNDFQSVLPLLIRHCYDLAFINDVVVELTTTETISIDYTNNQYLKYLQLYFPEAQDHLVYSNPNFKVFLVDSPPMPNQGRVISFVNGLMTPQGGVHVDTVFTALKDLIVPNVKNDSNFKLTIREFKNNFQLMILARVIDPDYNGQSKERLTSAKDLKFAFPKSAYRKMQNFNSLKLIKQLLDHKMLDILRKTDGKKTKTVNIAKASDANWAGGPKSQECILMVTEGDSASTYAVNYIALSPHERNNHGILPLRGKLLNTMKASTTRISENTEICNLKKMLGLVEATDYSSAVEFKKLRYGELLIAADADNDGYHILLLIVTFFEEHFPSLLERGYVSYLRTPLHTVWLTKRGKRFRFYNDADFEQFRKKHPDWKLTKDTYLYSKGLGTIIPKTPADYQARLLVKCLRDLEAPEMLQMTFGPHNEQLRKQWIETNWLNPHSETFELTDGNRQSQPLTNLINCRLFDFSKASLIRAIPNALSGMKKSQVQIIWGTIRYFNLDKKTPRTSDAKVAQLANKISEMVGYSHGETSLYGVLFDMSYDFVGGNNMPYFKSESATGSRVRLGKDHASPRYVFIQPNDWVSAVYRRDDLAIIPMEAGDDPDSPTTPSYLLPIIPMVLVNGCKGMGIGWSTNIPMFRPRDLIQWIRDYLHGKRPKELMPYYRGFTGKIRKMLGSTAVEDPGQDLDANLSSEGESAEEPMEEPMEVPDKYEHWEISGVYQTGKSGEISITEIPPNRSLQNYEDWLKTLVTAGKIKSVSNHCNNITGKVSFTLTGVDPSLNSLEALRLKSRVATSNFIMLDHNCKPIRFKSVGAYMESFIKDRLQCYQQRIDYQIKMNQEKLPELEEKIRFIQMVLSGTISVWNKGKSRPKKDLLADLLANDFAEEISTKLLGMAISAFTQEEIDRVNGKIEEIKTTLEYLQKNQPKHFWIKELEELLQHHSKFL